MSITINSFSLSNDPIRNIVIGTVTSIGINDNGTLLVAGYYTNTFPTKYTFNGTTWSVSSSMFTSTNNVSNTSGTNFVTMSSDGGVVVYVGAKIYIARWDGSGFTLHTTIDISTDICLQCGINNDGSTIVYKRGSTIYISRYNSGTNTYVSYAQTVGCSNFSNLAMTRSGNRIAFTTGTNSASGPIYFSNVDNSTGNLLAATTITTNTDTTYYNLTFSPDSNGTIIFVGAYGKGGAYANKIYYLKWNATTSTYDTITQVAPAGMYIVDAATVGRMGSVCYTSSNKLYYCQWGSNGNVSVLNANATIPSVPVTDISFDRINTKPVALGNVQVSINDANNAASNNLYYFYSVNSTPPTSNSFVLNTGSAGSPYKFYVPTTDISNTIYVQAKNASGNTSNIANLKVISYVSPRVPPIYNLTFVGSGNIQVIVGESVPPPDKSYYYLNNVSYVAYLYTGGTNQSGNLSFYTRNVGVLANTNTTYGNVVSYISGLSANTYTVYLAAKNDFGNSLSNITSQTIFVSTIPGNVSLSATTVAAGNVLVSITDVSNTSTVNDVYYFYSTDGTTFANTNILAGSTASPYSLFLNLQDISNTIYVRATNSLGNSATANIRALVYQEPRNPPIFGVSLVGSGNLQVTVGENDGITTIPNYYYLNNVSYVAYLYSGGDNQSGNLSFYTTNVGVLSNTNITYGNVVSYISGLSANTYTVYLAARNSVGNTISYGANQTVSVYTTPGNVSLTSATTVAAGNVLVSITDVSNTSTVNDVYYFYSTDGTTFANTNILAGSTASPYSLFLNLQDISNTIYVRATNSLGNSATANIRALVYQEPRNPPIFGVSLVGSGNLQVTVGENDGISTIPNYYYLNNVSYVAYLYTDGDNQSGNLSFYTRNVGVLANTNTTYGNVVSYITGLSANTYTVYLAAINTVGNTISYSANRTVTVTSIPSYAPVIDIGNTYSNGSGNLTITFTDSFNDPINQISYSYYLYNETTNQSILLQ